MKKLAIASRSLTVAAALATTIINITGTATRDGWHNNNTDTIAHPTRKSAQGI